MGIVKCSCPDRLVDFIGKCIRVETLCGGGIGRLVEVQPTWIELVKDHCKDHPIIIMCNQICLVRVVSDDELAGIDLKSRE